MEHVTLIRRRHRKRIGQSDLRQETQEITSGGQSKTRETGKPAKDFPISEQLMVSEFLCAGRC